MTQTVKTDGADPMMQGLIALTQTNRDQAIEVWSQGLNAYARYLTALAHAKRPEDILAANTDMAQATMEAFSKAAGAMGHLDGRSQKPT